MSSVNNNDRILAKEKDKMITIEAGPGAQRLKVHKNLISTRSAFVKTEVARLETTHQDLTISFPDDNPETFSDYIDSMYNFPFNYNGARFDSMMNLLNVYLLAEKLGDLPAANLAIDKIINLQFRNDDDIKEICSLIKTIYARTRVDSPLRRLMIDYHVHEGEDTSAVKNSDEFPLAFWKDVVQGSQNVRDMCRGMLTEEAFEYRYIHTRWSCFYHQHNDKFPICKQPGGDILDF